MKVVRLWKKEEDCHFVVDMMTESVKSRGGRENGGE
jgi:hypothetical protein